MAKKKPATKPESNGSAAIVTETITVPMIEVKLPIGDYGESDYITKHVETTLDQREAIALKHLVSGAYDGSMSHSKVVKMLLSKAADELGLPTDIKGLSEHRGKLAAIPTATENYRRS